MLDGTQRLVVMCSLFCGAYGLENRTPRRSEEECSSLNETNGTIVASEGTCAEFPELNNDDAFAMRIRISRDGTDCSPDFVIAGQDFDDVKGGTCFIIAKTFQNPQLSFPCNVKILLYAISGDNKITYDTEKCGASVSMEYVNLRADDVTASPTTSESKSEASPTTTPSETKSNKMVGAPDPTAGFAVLGILLIVVTILLVMIIVRLYQKGMLVDLLPKRSTLQNDQESHTSTEPIYCTVQPQKMNEKSERQVVINQIYKVEP